ncbi:DUF4259 domain-containing protein [Streptomyces sp. 71268]|uniref:DUF4259 domain-containing protein n=1 Tax=Streptomyces sp. 71268 TaxID=3002640 RepID=UPI0023F8AF3C|nr:DUF4259 domain-containing protein [Streptomyces sp. 71268]WEV27964.1 DUF4259 domain-containing protein [Streptomyces sp. 71268]
MGTWGSGNFENDTSAEHLAEFVDRIVAGVADAMAGDPVELEPDEYRGNVVPCDLELLYVLTRAGYGAERLPRPEVIEGWKDHFTAVWERTIDGLEPSEGFKDERRAVLVRTFDQLTEVAEAAAARG